MNGLEERVIALSPRQILVEAVRAGHITELACEMPWCGSRRGRGWFSPDPDSWWRLTPDRHPVPGCRGGRYVVENVRLAHWYCNAVDGGTLASKEDKERSGRKAGCTTHRIKRGLACGCGMHEEANESEKEHAP